MGFYTHPELILTPKISPSWRQGLRAGNLIVNSLPFGGGDLHTRTSDTLQVYTPWAR
jgi:hypothetical protein